MRKPFPAGRLSSFAFALALGLASSAYPQDTPKNSPAMPTDPKDLMLLASQLNDLTAGDVKPWHIKANWQLLDEQGHPTDEGTYEEFWAGPTKFKRTFTGKAFAQTDYGTEQGILRAGMQQDIFPLLQAMRHDLISPLPAKEFLQQADFSSRFVETGGVKLLCLQQTAGIRPSGGLSACVGAEKLDLRISPSEVPGVQILHNGILSFQGRYVAGDLKMVRAGKPVVTAHVDSIEVADPLDAPVFTPPADAVLLPRRVNISAGIAQGMLVENFPPIYPAYAKANHITGTVVLQALIGKDGSVNDLKVVSGPPDLQMAALDAVRRWRYRPYLLNGEPVEVRTTINVIFTLSR